MPIVSKTFDYKRRQRNGTWNVRERHTDVRGKHHYFRYNAASEAEADAFFAARNVEPAARQREADDFRDYLEQGKPIAGFQFGNLTRTQAKAVVRRFVVEERDDLLQQKAILDAVIAQVQ